MNRYWVSSRAEHKRGRGKAEEALVMVKKTRGRNERARPKIVSNDHILTRQLRIGAKGKRKRKRRSDLKGRLSSRSGNAGHGYPSGDVVS
jgi:hypothetical protein